MNKMIKLYHINRKGGGDHNLSLYDSAFILPVPVLL